MTGALDFERLDIVQQAHSLFTRLDALPEDVRIDTINAIRLALHEHSPMRDEPADCVLWIASEQVQANDYNPNVVAPPEMKLLRRSVESDGYTQPIVVWPVEDRYEVVDGFHRTRVGTETARIRKRLRGRLPVAIIKSDRTSREDRIAATVRHNRARGKHTVDGMAELVLDLSRRNHSDEWIARELGMDADEVLRLKQITGLAELFADQEFSEAWEVR